jgi:hypothetical protein
LGCEKKPEEKAQQPPDTKPGPAIDSRPRPPGPTLGEPKYRVTVDNLTAEFEEDWQAAMTKYRNTVVEVSGTTSEHAALGKTVYLPTTSPDFGYRWVVGFRGSGRFDPFTCSGRDLAIIGKLFGGQQVRIKGRLTTEGDNFFPKLKESEVVEFGPDTSVKLSAVELGGAASRDRPALDKRCEKRSLLLSGTVVAGVMKGDAHDPIELQSDGKTRVFCYLGASSRFYDKGFAAGEKITFVGEMEPARADEPGRITVRDCVPVNRLPE